MFKIFILTLLLFISSCGPQKIDLPKSDHFDGEVFHNFGEKKSEKSFIDFLKWRFTSKRDLWPKWVDVKQQKVPKQRVKEGEVSVTFINHATLLLQIDGVNILTDPVYSKRTSPFSFVGPKRVKLPGVKFEDLPKIDAVLISHNHYDSFDVKTLNRLIVRDNPYILMGLGNDYYLDRKNDKKVKTMDWHDNFEFKGLKFVFLPCMHWSKRGLFDLNKTLWGGFAILGSKKVYFAGDTGYGDHFKAANKQFGSFDLSIIPIGGYEPRWFMAKAHTNPEESVLAHLELQSKKSIGYHFGTFQLTNESIDDPIIDLEVAKVKYNLKNDEFITLDEGASFILK